PGWATGRAISHTSTGMSSGFRGNADRSYNRVRSKSSRVKGCPYGGTKTAPSTGISMSSTWWCCRINWRADRRRSSGRYGRSGGRRRGSICERISAGRRMMSC
ncbi:hypothetical protein LTR74_009196, partial [Friedmanniomyces endolithicus]